MTYTQDRITVTHPPCTDINRLTWAEVEIEEGRIIDLNICDYADFAEHQRTDHLARLSVAIDAELASRGVGL